MRLKSQRLVIAANRPDANYWHDVWAFRELAGVMAWRDVVVRYKQSVLGILWAVIRPLVTMLVGVLVFGKLAGFENNALGYAVDSYALFIFAGNLPWLFVTTGMILAASSFTRDAGLIRKVFYPRVLSPVSALAIALVDLLIGLALFFLIMLFLGFLPSWHALMLPVFLLPGAMLALGMGLLLGTLNVRFRDISQMLPFVVQIGLFLTPVMYPITAIGDRFGDYAALIYALNPMVGVLEGWRWALLGGGRLDPVPLVISLVAATVLLVLGHWVFRRTEKTFADVV